MHFRPLFILCIICFILPTKAQTDFIELNGGFKGRPYTYFDYVNDQNLQSRIYSEFTKDNYDTIAVLLPKYKNRLGYNYYVMMAGFLQMEHDPYAFNYLDSAFQRGAAPACILTALKGFKEEDVQERFLKNTMRAYDRKLISKMDSLLLQDQLYRAEIRKLAGYDLMLRSNYSVDMPSKKWKVKLEPRIRRQIDSLLSLQVAIDKSNFEFISQMGAEGNVPTAKRIGIHYCYKAAPDIFQIFARTLSNSEMPEAGVTLLNHYMRICSYQEEDWGKLETFLQFIYGYETEFFREFYFLNFRNGEIDKFESALALNQMVIAIYMRKNSKLELSSSNSAEFERLRDLLIYFSKFIIDPSIVNSEESRKDPLRERIKKEDIIFVPNSSLPPSMVLFRFFQE